MSSLRDKYAQIVQGVKSNSEFEGDVALALGLIGGSTPDIKFGHSPHTTNTESDVWQYSATQPVYVFPNEAGELLQIRSTLGDAQEIHVIGLDENGIFKEEVKALNGTTPVALTGLWTAVNRAHNDNGAPCIGNVIIEGDGSTSANVFAYMVAIDQQTTQCVYKVASDKVAVIVNISTSANRTAGATLYVDFRFKTRRPGKVFRSEFVFGLQKDGTSALAYEVVGIYGASTELKITALPVVTDTDVSAQFSIILIDKTLVPTDVLNNL